MTLKVVLLLSYVLHVVETQGKVYILILQRFCRESFIASIQKPIYSVEVKYTH